MLFVNSLINSFCSIYVLKFMFAAISNFIYIMYLGCCRIGCFGLLSTKACRGRNNFWSYNNVAGKHMSTKKLNEERDALKKQIENLQNELKGLERAIRVVSGSDEALSPASQFTRTRTKNVKNTVLTLVSQSGNSGITVVELMDKAEASHVALEKASVSSLLSRLKKEGVLRISDGRYYDISQNIGSIAPH
jgi:hypothetical protein